jgi:hypothetical protein
MVESGYTGFNFTDRFADTAMPAGHEKILNQPMVRSAGAFFTSPTTGFQIGFFAESPDWIYCHFTPLKINTYTTNLKVSKCRYKVLLN